MKKLTKQDYQVSKWSGGTTTQLIVSPPGADYGTRIFDWRISSASVDVEHSYFTPLAGVKRIIIPLSGNLKISFNNSDPIILKPFEQISFSGDTPTESWGKVIDFNVMCKNGFTAEVDCLHLIKDEEYNIGADSAEYFIYCYTGEIIVETIVIGGNESYIIKNERCKFKVKQQARVIVVKLIK